MRRLIIPVALAALALAGCATVPAPLQGQYSNVSPRDAIASEQRGMPVRWGGRIVSTDPLADRNHLDVVPRLGDHSAAHSTRLGWDACAAGEPARRHDPGHRVDT